MIESPTETIDRLFRKYEIYDLPRDRVHETIREKFTQDDLDTYKATVGLLYDSGRLDIPGVIQ